MFDIIARLLAWLFDLWPSFGGSIILLTMVVMLITTPLTIKGTRSMIQMQRLQPELKAIQERHKNDRVKMNEEVMAFYQQNNINPLGGCFPMLVQFPVFIVLYQVLRGLTRRDSSIGQQGGWSAAEIVQGDGTTAVIAETSRFNPAYLDHTTDLYQKLAATNEMPFLGIDLARSARSVLGDSFTSAIPYLLMILAVGATTYFNQRQIQGRSTSQANPQQQLLLKVMPFFLPVISFSLQASLVVYFLVSNLYRFAQQGYITRALYGNGQAEPVVVSNNQKSGNQKSGNQKSKAGNKANTGSAKSSGQKGKKAPSGAKASGKSSKQEATPPPPGRAKRKNFGDRPTKSNKSSSTGKSGERTSGRTTPKGGVTPRARNPKKRK